jgi:K+-sensing histidine kinase KdpD
MKLERAGYTVDLARDGQEGLTMYATGSYDVVAVDYKMPIHDGLEVIRTMASQGPLPPTIVITGTGSEKIAVEAMKLGARDYIVKDAEGRFLDLLPTVIEQVLQQQRLVEERQQAMETLKQRAAQLALLNDVGGKIAATLELDSLLDRAAHLVQEGFGYHHVALFTVDRERGELVMRARSGDFVTLFPSDHQLKLGQGMVGWVGRHGERLLANDVRAEPHYVNLFPDVIPTQSELSVPIRVGEEIVGVLDAQSPRLNAFDETDVMLMETLADQIAVAIENARLYEAVQQELTERKQADEALRRRNRGLVLLNRAGQEFAATLDLQQVVEQLLQGVTEIIGADGASVWLRDEEQEGWLVCQAAFRHDHKRSLVNLRLRPGQGVAGWVAQTGESAIVPYTSDDSRFFSGIDEQIGFRTTSLLAVPLRASGQVIGVLEVVNKLHGDFDTDDRALVETLATSAAIAIQNARLVEALRQRTVELQTRNEELDAFAHIVAHDLKNPLGHIVGFARVVEKDYATLPEEELSHYLHTITQSARKMSNIIDELLLLAGVHKIEEAELGPLDMAGIVDEVQRRLAYMIETHQAEIILPQSWPVALGYGPWVEEMWVNYLSNAIKYGGRPPRVELGATVQADGQVCFWVRDNGPGLTPEEQARLFTPFTRLDQVRAKGHGLGLSIARHIAEKLGGQVKVESQVGQGSVFSFTLPASF